MSCDVGKATERLEKPAFLTAVLAYVSSSMGGSPDELSEELVT